MKLAAGTIRNPAIIGKFSNPNNAAGGIEAFVTLFIGLATLVGGIYFIIQIFTGAVAWISAGSDKDGVQRAQKKFSNAVVGLIILIFCYTLIGLVGTILGFNVFDISSSISKIRSAV